MKYRKKPVEIEAMQLTRGNFNSVLTWCDSCEPILAENEAGVTIPTLEGNHLASWGDFIIKGIKGEFYPCKPDIFQLTYDKVD